MLKVDKPQELQKMRHSSAHVLACAVLNLYPETNLAIGPVIENGFYYDFGLPEAISEKDLSVIEKEMKKIIARNLSFERFELSIAEAIERERKNKQTYKVELIEDLKKGGLKKVSYYRTGQFADLCEGPHVKNTKEIGAFKLLSLAGAYWRGSEKNPMLTRIYGACFQTREELQKHLKNLEEAKLRDHRKLGRELELFTFSEEIGPGLTLWLPKGTIIKEELEKLAKEKEEEEGYLRISTPHITKENLYYTSGHLPYYEKEMFPKMESDEGNYYLKPMSCPHTHMVYKSKPRSYRELPIRFAEFGTVYRFEKSGELTGLLRVRGMTQNDAHIYSREDQVIDELESVMKLHKYYYDLFDIREYWVELSLPDFKKRPDKYFDDPRGWKKAIEILRQAAKKSGVDYIEEEGSAAFYGPKFDFNIKSAIGRTFGASTNQLDFGSASRFKLTYIDKSGQEKLVPYIIHRAPLGSDERFIGFLIEHFGGAFPTWMSPIQVALVPISDRNLEYATKISQVLKKNGVRVAIDDRSETMQAKIRDATIQKISYMGIVGDREEKEGKISIRTREGIDLGSRDLKSFIEEVTHEIKERLSK